MPHCSAFATMRIHKAEVRIASRSRQPVTAAAALAGPVPPGVALAAPASPSVGSPSGARPMSSGLERSSKKATGG